jgi:hypothetical protein
MNDKTGGNRGLRRAGALAAYAACRHLLPGGPSLAEVQRLAQQEQRKQQLALPASVQFSRCLRRHGVPNFPDPAANGQGTAPSGRLASTPARRRSWPRCVPASMCCLQGRMCL